MTTVELIHAGYIRDDSRVGSSISLIRDGDAIIVADPGLVASHARILDPLRAEWYRQQGMNTICPTRVAIDMLESAVREGARREAV